MAIDYATSELNFDEQNWLAEDGSPKRFYFQTVFPQSLNRRVVSISYKRESEFVTSTEFKTLYSTVHFGDRAGPSHS